MNPDEELKARLRELKARGATDEDLAAYVDAWDAKRGTMAGGPSTTAAVDRTDQTTVRNPEGQDPFVKYGLPIAAGLATGAGAGSLLARLGARGIAQAVGSGVAGDVVAGGTGRAITAKSGGRTAAALDPGAVAVDATLGGLLGGGAGGVVAGGSALAKRLGLFRRQFGVEEAGRRLGRAADDMGATPAQLPDRAAARVGPDGLVLNAGEPTALLARNAVRNSQRAHGAVLPALNRQQLGAKDRASELLRNLFGPNRGTQPAMAQGLADAGRTGPVPAAYQKAWDAQPGPIADPDVLAGVQRGEAVLPKGEPERIVQDLEKLTKPGTFLRTPPTPPGPPTDAQVAQWLTATHGIPANRVTPQMVQQARPIVEAAGVASPGAPAEQSLQYAAELKSRVGKAAKHRPPNEIEPTATHTAAVRTDEQALRDPLHALSPEYRRADELYAANKAQQRALEQGHAAAGSATSAQGVHDFRNTVGRTGSPAAERLAQGAFRQGQRARYAERIEAAPREADPVSGIFGSDAQRALIDETAQAGRAQQVGPTVAREQALRGDASHVGEPLLPKETDVTLDPGEWSIRQGYVGNVLFPAADVAARIGKRNVARVGRAADDRLGALLSRPVRNPEAARTMIRHLMEDAQGVGRRRDTRSRWLSAFLGSLSGTATSDREGQ